MTNPVYPRAIKVFTIYHDYTDVIWALSINEVNAEVAEIERTLGANPLNNTPYRTFGGAIQDLWANKAPSTHTHSHHLIQDDNVGDDHQMYSKVDGSRAFTHAVGGVAGTNPANLVTLKQLQDMAYVDTNLVNQLIAKAIKNLVFGAFGGPPLYAPFGNPAAPDWILKGGILPHSWPDGTDANGIVHVPFGTGFPHGVQALAATKIPVQHSAGYAAAPNGDYNHIETQITLVGASLGGAVIQFSHDYSWQPYMNVALSWLAIGW